MLFYIVLRLGLQSPIGDQNFTGDIWEYDKTLLIVFYSDSIDSKGCVKLKD